MLNNQLFRLFKCFIEILNNRLLMRFDFFLERLQALLEFRKGLFNPNIS